jgi:prophage DNA circulation protein
LAAQNGLAAAVLTAAQVATAGETARAASSLDLTDRASAKEALAALIAATDPVIDAAAQTLDADVSQALADAQIAAVRALNASMLDTAPLIEVSATFAYPASAAAFVLYGDPSRADELLARNGVGTPLFMPNVFVALAE